ncbi:DUF1254 domain-containing protein [Piscinibacter sp. HJYY11]|uniref:DUF1254 domain-containing protein n=1 Tax=Piscinibacter sp. HJYY11 TaxID=2801333 RepID=UPI00191EDCDD|nr:DUF1254 domain-containing protein [Piscinibacter sp. HJYY11]MBL0730075.1 DUF1254 domain-containing protein [Piscinibacter sp. HJYY11]
MPALDADLQAAYVYTFPYYEMARQRFISSEVQRTPVNTFGHRRTLADHTARAVTTPNNDTLYSSAWLDLSAGPLELTVPRMPAGRYWSMQFMDATTSTVALLGSRHEGEGDFKVWIAREGDTTEAPAGMRVLRLATRDVWMLGRIVVDGPHDLPAVQALQDGFRLRAVKAGSAPAGPVAPTAPRGSPTDGANYLAVVNDMLQRSGVPAADQEKLKRWSAFGIGSAAPTPEQGAALTAALPELNAQLRNGAQRAMNASLVRQWSYPNPAIGTFGSDVALRATVALVGLAALPPSEAIYLGAVASHSDKPFHGSQRYRVRVPAQGLEAQAFWSLSMYQVEPDGRLFFVDNPIKRYAVGNRTPGLVKNADGSLDFYVQAQEPADATQKANWLPAPSGPFRMTLRAYLPSPAMLKGEAPLPVVEALP